MKENRPMTFDECKQLSSRIIAMNPNRRANMGQISSHLLDYYTELTKQPWLAQLVGQIRDLTAQQEEMKAGETYQQLDRKISDLKKQLPFRSPHYFHFLEDHRAQKFIDPEAFTFQTTVDIDNPEEVEPAVKNALLLNGMFDEPTEKLFREKIFSAEDIELWKGKVLHIEPGLAFGTGSHPTTKLCLETLEKYIDENSTVLDIGCGSGILSIASLLLGAKSAFGVDIDSLAVKTAQANALENGFDESKFKAVQGNLSDKVSGKYNVVVANIVADIIMEFNKEVGKYLENDGVYITGGIIESREDEVLLSFAQNGFEVKERFEEKGWLVFVVKKSK